MAHVGRDASELVIVVCLEQTPAAVHALRVHGLGQRFERPKRHPTAYEATMHDRVIVQQPLLRADLQHRLGQQRLLLRIDEIVRGIQRPMDKSNGRQRRRMLAT